MKKIRIDILILLLSVISFACSSKKDDPSSPSNVNTNNVVTAPLSLHLHTYISDTEIDGAFVYRTANGRKMLLDTAQIYLSNI